MNESDYRRKIQETLARIERAFEDVDPDLVECQIANGQLTLTFSDQARWILSAQPSVRQLWVALASKGVAYHFNWDDSRAAWIDDKGQNLELVALLRDSLKERLGQEFL